MAFKRSRVRTPPAPLRKTPTPGLFTKALFRQRSSHRPHLPYTCAQTLPQRPRCRRNRLLPQLDERTGLRATAVVCREEDRGDIQFAAEKIALQGVARHLLDLPGRLGTEAFLDH